MGFKKLVQIILVAIIAIGTVLGSLSHATRGESSTDVSKWKPNWTLVEITIHPQIQRHLDQVTGYLNALEPDPGLIILRPDGKVFLMPADANPNTIRDILGKLETRADGPNNGYIDEREDRTNDGRKRTHRDGPGGGKLKEGPEDREDFEQRADPPGGGRNRAVESPASKKQKRSDGEGRGKGRAEKSDGRIKKADGEGGGDAPQG